jgi:single stranded DNA-binding protein
MQGSGTVEEVEWKAENQNSVTLIGRLGREPEIKYFEDGKVTASVSIAVNRGKNAAASWFELDFWNETAKAVSEKLRKGQQVQVTGRLVQNTWSDRQTGMKREKIRVVVRDVAIVTGGMAGSQGGNFQDQGGYNNNSRQSYGGGGGGGSRGGSVQSKDIEGQWAALFCSPNDFWDNRATKRNPKAPDFKHKETGEALWVESRNTPTWVASSLKELDLNKQVDINALLGSEGQNRQNNEEIPF